MPASVPIKKVELYLTTETRDAAQNLEILTRLKELDYNAGPLKE
jgi:hypothetical protein